MENFQKNVQELMEYRNLFFKKSTIVFLYYHAEKVAY